MSIAAGCITPHPPIIVPEVGRGQTAEVQSTIAAMRDLSGRLASHEPETLIVMSPHSPYAPTAIPIRTDDELQGSFAAFTAPQVTFELESDVELAEAIVERAREVGLPVIPMGPGEAAASSAMYGAELDHGVLVPLYFLRERIEAPIVNLGLSFLPYDVHYQLGKQVRAATEAVGRRTVFVASGDLSHRLIPGAPAGYDPRGAELDRQIVGALEAQDYERLRHLDPELVEAGGECGLRSIVTLTGCFAGASPSCEVLSYEGPFGVGYAVAYMRPQEEE